MSVVFSPDDRLVVSTSAAQVAIVGRLHRAQLVTCFSDTTITCGLAHSRLTDEPWRRVPRTRQSSSGRSPMIASSCLLSMRRREPRDRLFGRRPSDSDDRRNRGDRIVGHRDREAARDSLASTGGLSRRCGVLTGLFDGRNRRLGGNDLARSSESTKSPITQCRCVREKARDLIFVGRAKLGLYRPGWFGDTARHQPADEASQAADFARWGSRLSGNGTRRRVTRSACRRPPG